jgi:Uma2 family endonuclease
LCGVPEYWLVEPGDQWIMVYSEPGGDQYRTQAVASDMAVSATIPELRADFAPLFDSIFDD